VSEVSGVTGEQVQRLVLFREIEQLLDGGFTGQITLHCNQGQIPRYTIEETRKPGAERVVSKRE